MTRRWSLTLALALAAAPALAQDLTGSYVSADGRVRHTFETFADYAATVTVGNRVLAIRGFYQEGENVCLVTSPDPRKGGAGNVLLYVGGNQCCLQVRPVWDKVVVTKVGMTGDGHGPGYFLCNDQTLNRTSIGGPPPEQVPPVSTARPRTLLPGAAP